MKSFVLVAISILVGFLIVFFLNPIQLTTRNTVRFESSPEADSSYSFEGAPTQSLIGKMTSIQGEVFWQSRTATEPSRLVSPVAVLQAEIVATGEDGASEVEFENGARVAVAAESNVEFVQTLPSHIVINHKAGSARYVAINNGSLAVRSLNVLAELGADTSVLIEREEGYLTFVVEKGVVTVAFNDLDNVSTTMRIREGERYIYNSDERSGQVE